MTFDLASDSLSRLDRGAEGRADRRGVAGHADLEAFHEGRHDAVVEGQRTLGESFGAEDHKSDLIVLALLYEFFDH